MCVYIILKTKMESETWVVWMLWRVFVVLLVKAMAISVTRLWHWVKNVRKLKDKDKITAAANLQIKPDYVKTLIRGIIIGLLGAFSMQMWNILEVIVLNRASRIAALIFYSVTLAFVYLALEHTEQEESDVAINADQSAVTGINGSTTIAPTLVDVINNQEIKSNARQAVVITALLNTFIKSKVQLFAGKYILNLF